MYFLNYSPPSYDFSTIIIPILYVRQIEALPRQINAASTFIWLPVDELWLSCGFRNIVVLLREGT